jgi:hypothetical protein
MDARRNTPLAPDTAESLSRQLWMADPKKTEKVLLFMAQKNVWMTPTIAVLPRGGCESCSSKE